MKWLGENFQVSEEDETMLLQADVYNLFIENTGTDPSLININTFSTAAKHVFDKLQTAQKMMGYSVILKITH